MKNKAARRYLRQVKLHLFCDRAHRKARLSRAQTMIEDFSEERPEAEYNDFVAAFGSPQGFAENILEGVEQAEIDSAKRRKKFLCRGVVILVILALIVASVTWYCKYEESKDLDKNITVIISTAKELTEEEFYRLTGQTPGS